MKFLLFNFLVKNNPCPVEKEIRACVRALFATTQQPHSRDIF